MLIVLLFKIWGLFFFLYFYFLALKKTEFFVMWCFEHKSRTGSLLQIGFHNWEVKFYSLWEDIWSLKPIHAYGFFLLMLSILKYLRLNQCSNEMMSAFLLSGCLCSRKRERGMGFMTFGFRLGSLRGTWEKRMTYRKRERS